MQELDEALTSALRWKFPECIDALLNHVNKGARSREIFYGRNLYHELFLYIDGISYRSPMSNVVESIRVLLSYNLDVNRKIPVGSYPLYSLITRIFTDPPCGLVMDQPSQQITKMACLEMLLEAGVNPNFDETELRYSPFLIRHVYGRTPFSSPLSGIFSIQSWNWPDFLVPLGQVCRLLLQHGSDPNHLDVDQGTTPLHDLMKLWAQQPTLPLCQIQSILLSYGADPNQTAHGIHNSYAVDYFFSILIKYGEAQGFFEHWLMRVSQVTPSHVLRLLLFMDSTCAAEAGKRISECGHEAVGAGMPANTFEEIQNSVWRVLHEAQTLLSLSQLAVWKAIGRNFHAAETRKWLMANLPQKILHDLDSMFVCNCQN